MRDRTWSLLVDVKFKALYCYECYRKSDKYFRCCSLLIALTSVTSITTWVVWKEIPTAWACIVAIAQFLIVAMPYFPFLKNGKDFFEMSHDFEMLYLDIEKLWCSLDSEKFNRDESEKLYYEYRERVIKIEKQRGADCPEIKCWMKKVDKETDKAIEINFYKVNK